MGARMGHDNCSMSKGLTTIEPKSNFKACTEVMSAGGVADQFGLVQPVGE